MKKALFVLPMLLLTALLWGQEKTVSGVITSAEDGLPVIGASILIKGTSNGTSTDLDGSYTLDVPGNDAVLIISYTGLKTIEILVGNRTKLDVVLESNIAFLDEVVVTGYGEFSKSGGYPKSSFCQCGPVGAGSCRRGTDQF